MLLNAESQRGRGASLNKASLAHWTISNIVYIVTSFIYKCTENIEISKVKCLQIFSDNIQCIFKNFTTNINKSNVGKCYRQYFSVAKKVSKANGIL